MTALPTTAAPEPGLVHVVDDDPALLGALEDSWVEAARRELIARVMHVGAGPWTPRSADVPRAFDGWLGLLVLDGLLVRQTEVADLRCCELLGPGDLLRPWDEPGLDTTVATTAHWRVLQPTRIALLDADFARRAARWPSLTAELLHRTISRTQSLSVLLALTQARRADVRLRTLFGHLADRWGRVTPSGIVLTLSLTHDLIAQLTGLRRPTVSLALGELERAGEIVRADKDRWVIVRRGPSPV